MPQGNQTVSNGNGAAVRAAINTEFAALYSNSSGASAPSVTSAYMFWYDSTNLQLKMRDVSNANWIIIADFDQTNLLFTPEVGSGVNTVASATTADIGAVPQTNITISGSITITSLGSSARTGTLKVLTFGGTLLLTYNSTTLKLPGAASIVTQPNDIAIARYEGSGNWRIITYLRANGQSISHTGAKASVASATTVDLGAQASNLVEITGTTTITGFGSSANLVNPIYFITFTGSLLLTYNSGSMIVPTAANITTQANDSAIAMYLGSGNWKILNYYPASGSALASGTTGALAHAWIDMNSNGTYFNAFGVASLTRNSAGNNTIAFSTNAGSANFCVNTTQVDGPVTTSNPVNYQMTTSSSTRGVGYCIVLAGQGPNGYVDVRMNVSVFTQ